MSDGTYTITNIPSIHPIALLNTNKTSLITYTGDSSKKSTKIVSGTSADGNYDFYYGNVTINVYGDFDELSVYCFHHGYMGGENLFKYSNTC